ncbi:MAG: VCBS repeat-containing protein [Acidobacteria bacterium]|nr:VCBS repeat-containing protein [Acidobacteriota bacterium]
MRVCLPLLLTFVAVLCQGYEIEHRGVAQWPTANHLRVTHMAAATAGVPVAVDFAASAGFNPDSVRVMAADSTSIIPSKTEWRVPNARVSFASSGARAYHIYFDEGRNGETKRLVAPAMVGTGDRITYGREGVRGRLAVGLWGHPAPIDFDGDGNIDLIVGCADRPYNGIYLFRNIGTNAEPLFDRAEWMGPGKKDLVAADFNGDGKIDLAFSGGYFSDVRTNRLSRPVRVKLDRDYHIGRDDLWYPVDWDGDGRIDVLAGVSDWREYGWDDAYNAKGEWMRGPLHGQVYFHRNTGSNENPAYAKPVALTAGGKLLDQYGSPAPNPVDWFGKGRLDVITGNFIDSLTLYANNGRGLDAGVPLQAAGSPIKLDLCMIQPRVVQWRADRGPSVIVAEEDGTISLFENSAPRGSVPQLQAERKLMQVDPYVKSGALSRPTAVDWNGDGRLDLIAGNSAGYVQYFENTGTREQPAFTDRGYLHGGGKVIHRMAGPNGSIQGPAETKWGYSNPVVADWDLDGKLDLIVNDIWGDVVWYRNTGSKTAPQLAAAASLEVEWQGRPPKPEWVWWEPKPKQLLTQWRTTPRVVDWDRDGLPDLVMLNHQGYLCLFRRARVDGQLRLMPPERIFLNHTGRFLNLANGRAGASGRRKIDFADMDGDGDLDLITDSDEGPVWHENIGSQQKPVMQSRGTVVKAKLSGHNPTPTIVDFNGDGKLDLIVGAEDGFFYYFDGRYIASLESAAKISR